MNFRKNGLLLAVICISLPFFGCKKTNDSPYFFKLKVDGQWVTWKFALGEIVPGYPSPGNSQFSIAATSEDEKQSLSWTVRIAGDFGTTIYATNKHEVVMTYQAVSGSTAKDYTNGHTPAGMSEPFYSITITSITDKEIRGNFIGNYLADTDDEVVILTEGEFFAQRVQ